MIRSHGLRLGLLGLLLSTPAWLGVQDADAICPSKLKPPPGGKAPGGSVRPGLREPFDPPPIPQNPVDPRDPTTPDPTGADPTTPGEKPGTPTTPRSTPLPPPATPPTPGIGGPTTPRKGGVRGLESLDDASWELWWGLNSPDVLPRVKRQSDSPDGSYARQLPPELRAAIDIMIEALDDEDGYLRQAAIAALVGSLTTYRAQDALEGLRRVATKGNDHWHRDLAHLGLGLRQDAESAEGMRQVLRSGHEAPVSRAFAALALIQLGEAKGMAEVAKAAADLDEPDIAGCILIGLGATKDKAHLPLIMEAAQRKAGAAVRLRRVRADALTALGKLGDPSTVSFLAGLLADKENSICRGAALALGGFKGSAEAAKALREVGLASEDAFVRGFSALSLGRIGDASVVPALARFSAAEKEVAVRPFVMLGAGLFRERSLETLLGDALQEDPRSGRFSAAALAAGLIGAADSRARLTSALTDTRTSSVPACSALALALLGTKEVQGDLRSRFWFDSARARPSGKIEGLTDRGVQTLRPWLGVIVAHARERGVHCPVLAEYAGA